MIICFADKIVFTADPEGNATPSEIPLPDLSSTGDYGAALVKMFLTLLAFIGLLILTFWFVRRLVQTRLRGRGDTQAIQILEKRMISSKSMLYLVEVDGQKILLAESHLEVRRLQSWPVDTNSPSPP